jgi:CheY-like chemotaxis protein
MPNGSMPQILVVDDDPGIRESLGILLTSVGYDVVVQKTALSWIEQFANLVVADLNMPGMCTPRREVTRFLQR